MSSEGFVKLLGKDEPENGLPCDAYHIWKRHYSLQASPDLKMVVILEGRKFSHDELDCYNTFHFNNCVWWGDRGGGGGGGGGCATCPVIYEFP